MNNHMIDAFYCIFPIRGHTHNRQDQANSAPSGKYYASAEISNHLQLVSFICYFY
jgi:hypothetical protein